jgi:hypothetical protein
MDTIRKDEQQESVRGDLVTNIILDVLRTVSKWINAEPVEIDIIVNGLAPIDRAAKETTIRELDFIELATHSHYAGVINKLEELYPTTDSDFYILSELIKGIRTAMFGCASKGVQLKVGDIHFTGVRREHGKAVWVERQPNLRESLEAIVLKLRHQGPDEGDD